MSFVRYNFGAMKNYLEDEESTPCDQEYRQIERILVFHFS
jgi:hypothetical protein